MHPDFRASTPRPSCGRSEVRSALTSPHCFVPQLCNPLGGSRGVHNIHCMYVSLLSLPPKLRHNHENIFLISEKIKEFHFITNFFIPVLPDRF